MDYSILGEKQKKVLLFDRLGDLGLSLNGYQQASNEVAPGNDNTTDVNNSDKVEDMQNSTVSTTDSVLSPSLSSTASSDVLESLPYQACRDFVLALRMSSSAAQWEEIIIVLRDHCEVPIWQQLQVKH